MAKVIWLFLSLLALTVFSTARAAELAVGGLWEFQHARGTTGALVEVRFDSGWSAHAAGFTEHRIKAVGFAWRPDVSWPLRPGIGASWLSERTRINGTRENFFLSLATPPVRLGARARCWAEWWHWSNGSGIFGWGRNRPNVGWNFLVGVCALGRGGGER